MSSYVQPSYFAPTLTGQVNPSTQGALPVVAGAGTISENNAIFLNCCLFQGVSFVLTDVVLRIPYYTYNDESAYAMVR